VANGVSLDFDNIDNDPRSMHHTEKVHPQHYAFQVSDEEYDAIFERVLSADSSTTQTRSVSIPVRSIQARRTRFYFEVPKDTISSVHAGLIPASVEQRDLARSGWEQVRQRCSNLCAACLELAD